MATYVTWGMVIPDIYMGCHGDLTGEDITEACQREVLEETGVPCQFVSILSFRHQHGYRFGCSDVYFVCLMRPVSEEINPCEKEIADCQWMDVSFGYVVNLIREK